MANTCFQLNLNPNTCTEFVYTLGLKFIYEVQREGNNYLHQNVQQNAGATFSKLWVSDAYAPTMEASFYGEFVGLFIDRSARAKFVLER